MKQHLTPEQFRAIPEAQRLELAGWCAERRHYANSAYATTAANLCREPHRMVLSIGVLLEYLHERGQEPYALDKKDGWRVNIGAEAKDEGFLGFTAPDLIDALWAAVCAVLAQEAS